MDKHYTNKNFEKMGQFFFQFSEKKKNYLFSEGDDTSCPFSGIQRLVFSAYLEKAYALFISLSYSALHGHCVLWLHET